MATSQSGDISDDSNKNNTSDPTTYSQLNKQVQDVNEDETATESASMQEDIERYHKNKQIMEEPEEEDIETDTAIDRKKDNKRGMFPRLGCSCRSCGCYGCLLLIMLIVLIGSLIYFRPEFVWNGVKDFLNEDYHPNTTTSVAIDSNEVIQILMEEGRVELTEPELQALVRARANSQAYYVDVEPSYLRVVRDLDRDADKPLWLLLELGQGSDSSLSMTKVGFQRISLPSFLRESISDMLFSTLNVTGVEGQTDGHKFIRLILNADNTVSIGNVRFDKDKVTIEN